MFMYQSHLTSTTALGALILVVLLQASVNENGSVMAASTGVCIEQGILLIVSLTPIKAQEELKKCCQSIRKLLPGINKPHNFPCRKDTQL